MPEENSWGEEKEMKVFFVVLLLAIFFMMASINNREVENSIFEKKLNSQKIVTVSISSRMGTIDAVRKGGWDISKLSQSQRYSLLYVTEKRSGHNPQKPWQIGDTAKVPAPFTP